MNKRILIAISSVIALICLNTSSVLAVDFDGPAAESVFRFQKKMADKGLPQSQYKLAMMYETGAGVDKQITTAKVWYNRAALQNYKPARHRLTYLAIKERGYNREYDAWIKDLKRDATFGNGEAMFLLGQMYAEGVGVSRDLPKSMVILRKASAANVAGAEAELLRVEASHNRELQLIAQQKAEQQAREQQLLAEREKQLREAKLKQLQQQEQQKQKRLQEERQRQLAEQQRQQELARQTAIKKAEQKKLEAVKARLADTPHLISDSSGDTICSGRNMFSATCR